MKRQDEFSVGGSILATIVFVILAVVTYQTDDHGNPLAWIPGIGAIIGVIMTIVSAVHENNKDQREGQQNIAAKAIIHDSEFGNGDLKMYFNSSESKVTICATTTEGSNKKEVYDFKRLLTAETDNHIVAVDSSSHKVIRAKSVNGQVALGESCIDEELQAKGSSLQPSEMTIKTYNDYAFITDDVNESVTIVTPTKIHVLRYSDIVSISYEENGSDVYNKSLGGAVAGGILFGGVGAIVGSNTSKTTQNKEVKNMSIKILLKSTSNSTIVLTIYNGYLKTKEDADRALYEGLMKEVSGIKDIFSIIIDMVDKNIAVQKNAPVAQPSNVSVADELTKLAKLKEAGILSEEEFQTQKMKLLN